MTTLTLRRIRDGFLVTGPDIAPATFKTRREAKDWCAEAQIHRVSDLLSSCSPWRQLLANASMAASRVAS
jgi:hypothetical protein